MSDFYKGARNPYDVLQRWPEYLEGMGEIRKVLISQIQKFTDLQNLAGACGENPVVHLRSPPRSRRFAKLLARCWASPGSKWSTLIPHHRGSGVW